MQDSALCHETAAVSQKKRQKMLLKMMFGIFFFAPISSITLSVYAE